MEVEPRRTVAGEASGAEQAAAQEVGSKPEPLSAEDWFGPGYELCVRVNWTRLFTHTTRPSRSNKTNMKHGITRATRSKPRVSWTRPFSILQGDCARV